jgi:putative addiction module killer protein
MIIRRSSIYKKWYKKLADPHARYRISIRVKRLEEGNHGNVKPIGEGCSEMRIDYGPGYRVYYKTIADCQDNEKKIIILLCGGDKSTQDEDIKQAKKIAAAYNPDEEG